MKKKICHSRTIAEVEGAKKRNSTINYINRKGWMTFERLFKDIQYFEKKNQEK